MTPRNAFSPSLRRHLPGSYARFFSRRLGSREGVGRPLLSIVVAHQHRRDSPHITNHKSAKRRPPPTPIRAHHMDGHGTPDIRLREATAHGYGLP
jgi:hypothetical protein